MIKYSKQGLSRESLAKLAIERGLSEADPSKLEDLLQHVSYFRFSGYWLHYKQLDDSLRASPSLHTILAIYCFDQKMRLLVLKSIQHIENTLRAMFIDYYATQYKDPFAYLEHSNFPNMTAEKHAEKICSIQEETSRSQALFVIAYRKKYENPLILPVWMAIEVASFSTLVYLCIGAEYKFKESLSRIFNMPFKVLDKWFIALRLLRNKCAHHERVWDIFYYQPKLLEPRKYKFPEWNSDIVPKSSTFFYRLLMLEHMISNLPYSDFSVYHDVADIVDTYPKVPLKVAGFPENWKDCPVWA